MDALSSHYLDHPPMLSLFVYRSAAMRVDLSVNSLELPRALFNIFHILLHRRHTFSQITLYLFHYFVCRLQHSSELLILLLQGEEPRCKGAFGVAKWKPVRSRNVKEISPE